MCLNNLFEIQIESSPEGLFEQEYRVQIKDRDNFEAIVKIMKSNSILMLYNLVGVNYKGFNVRLL